MKRALWAVLAAAGVAIVAPGRSWAADSPLDAALRDGGPARALDVCRGAGLDARFGRAAGLFLGAVERLCQRLHAMGAGATGTDNLRRSLPFLRMPVAPCAKPEEATPAKVGAAIGNFAATMREVTDALENLPEGEFATRVDLGAAWIDLDGDGRRGATETLRELFFALRGRGGGGGGAGDALVVQFDRADAFWLRAYSNLLAGLADLLLAYDWMPAWEQCAHLLFARPVPMPPVAAAFPRDQRGAAGPVSTGDIADAIAALHCMHLPCVNPTAFARAAQRFRAMAASCAACLETAAAERDDEREWIPGPRQHSVTGLAMGQDRADAWRAMLDELDAALAGRRLVPFWRLAHVEGAEPGQTVRSPADLNPAGAHRARGINLARLITAPPLLDLVLLIQGAALIPYIEEGELMRPEVWRALQAAFRGEFLGMLIFVN